MLKATYASLKTDTSQVEGTRCRKWVGMVVTGDLYHLNDLLFKKRLKRKCEKNKLHSLVDGLYLYLYIFPKMFRNYSFLRIVLAVLLLHSLYIKVSLLKPEEISYKKCACKNVKPLELKCG